jgi:hypothetical protein
VPQSSLRIDPLSREALLEGLGDINPMLKWSDGMEPWQQADRAVRSQVWNIRGDAQA